MSGLRVENLSKSFGGLKVLEGVNFAVEPGEKLAMIGPNGAGKSTLLNVIGGQLPASGGEVFLNEHRITKLAPHKRLHLGLGRSYQINNLFFSMSVWDNLLLAVYGARKSHFQMFTLIEKRAKYLDEAEQLLRLVGLWEKRDESLHTLSYGDQRLVELLCAFTAKPSVVLLDEPSAGLPTAEAVAFADVIRKLAGDTTLVFCAHDMDLVFNLADSIMVLYGGTIITKGLPQDIAADPKVREIYLGSAESC
jgi:branched-chain amino acid transport system ATP-binding protein